MKWASQADAVVIVVEVAGAGAFNLRRVATEAQRGLGQRNFSCARLDVFALIDEYLVPVELEIGRQPNAPGSRGQLACEINDDGALKAGGKPASPGIRCQVPSASCAST